MSTQKARKGDLVLVEKVSRDYVIGKGSQERTTYQFGLVGSATREGQVKTWRAIGWGDSLVSESAQPIRYARRWVMPAVSVDVEAALRAAKDHHWPGHPGQPKDFDSLESAKDAIRHLVQKAA